MVEDWVKDALHSHTFEGCEGLKARELDCFTSCVGELVRPFKAGSLSTGLLAYGYEYQSEKRLENENTQCPDILWDGY